MIYRDDIPVKDWCEKHSLPLSKACMSCQKMIHAKRPAISKKFIGVEMESCCKPVPEFVLIPTNQKDIELLRMAFE